MAAATPGGSEGGGGGEQLDRGFLSSSSDSEGERWVDIAVGEVGAKLGPSSTRAATTRLAKAVHALPAKTSHRWASSFCGGVDLDDDIWDIRFNFPRLNNLERTLCKSTITVLNLLALIEEHGYGDNMYYVKEKGKGQRGIQLIESMNDVRIMLRLFDKEKILNITIMKKNDSWPVELNMEDVQVVKLEYPTLFSVNIEGVAYMSDVDETFPLQQSQVIHVDMYEANPVALDYSDVLFLGTQQSFNRPKGKEVAFVDVSSNEKEELGLTLWILVLSDLKSITEQCKSVTAHK